MTMSRTLTLTLAVALVALGGCNKQRRAGERTGATDFSTSLADLESQDQQRASSDAQRPALEDVFRDNAAALLEGAQTPVESGGPPPRANPEPALDIGDAEAASATAAPIRPESRAAAPDESAPERVETTEERRMRLVAELAAAIRDEPASQSDPVRREAMLAALSLLSPAVTPNHRDLVERERAVLEPWWSLFEEIREGMQGSAGDLAAIPGAASRLDERLASAQALTITESRLCARVEGFGRYTPLPTRLLAGRPHPAIVYTEVDHFGTRPGAGPDGEPGHTVELTQELTLYHDADGLLAWRRPEQTVRDFSRNRRRDFFIVQRVDLPQTLTVGVYRLKVTVRDQVTGETTEALIPIEVVADAALIRSGR